MTGTNTKTPKPGYADENTQRIPIHQQVYLQLRDLILFGELAPGQAVTIQGLIASLEAGMTPVREAIRRLTSEGALEFQGNRRVIVPTPDVASIEEMIYARQALEPELALRAARRATKEDLNALKTIDDRLDQAISRGDVGLYLRENYAFHAKMYEMSGAPILTDIANGLWLRYGPSLRVVCGRMGTENLVDHHKEALEALAAGDPERVATAIQEDVVQGMVQMRQAMNSNQIDSA
ncbi:GntR family transcriptional regulator [uncultured Shimia sp.]|uniref:GntR family transcriptional regulator n=1 Tax=uncultured Shimia sp. TaxID=573152 RepID=UPI00261D8DB5|nr:GntR family transcriptional regulator [uncultured Shimia sp.]